MKVTAQLEWKYCHFSGNLRIFDVYNNGYFNGGQLKIKLRNNFKDGQLETAKLPSKLSLRKDFSDITIKLGLVVNQQIYLWFVSLQLISLILAGTIQGNDIRWSTRYSAIVTRSSNWHLLSLSRKCYVNFIGYVVQEVWICGKLSTKNILIFVLFQIFIFFLWKILEKRFVRRDCWSFSQRNRWFHNKFFNSYAWPRAICDCHCSNYTLHVSHVKKTTLDFRM